MPLNKDILITPPNRGIPVYFTDNIRDKALTLLQAEKERYYYAVMAMKHLRALSSGLMGKDNVFIPNIKDFKTNSFQNVVVYVPGIKANVERRADGGLRVTDLVLDDHYYKSIAHKSKNKPGVYRVSKGGANSIVASYKANGRITTDNARRVVVSDTHYASPEKAAEEAMAKLGDIFNSEVASQGKFDLFYSPVGSKLGGMRNYTPEPIVEGYAFSGILADAIERSKNQELIVWASELSGSVVLTQALQILATKKVSFKDKDHLVKMHLPTTDPKPALSAANEMGMLVDKKLARGNGNVRASASLLITNASRARNPNDHYTWADYRNDISNGTMAALSAAGAISFAASAVISSPFLVYAGAVSGGAGAAQLAYKTYSNLRKRG